MLARQTAYGFIWPLAMVFWTFWKFQRESVTFGRGKKYVQPHNYEQILNFQMVQNTIAKGQIKP